MRTLGTICAALVAILPMFWLPNYTITSPVWWTVVLAWSFGRLFGYFEREKENKEDDNNE